MQKLKLVCLSAFVVLFASCTQVRYQPSTSDTELFSMQDPVRTEWPETEEPRRQEPRRQKPRRTTRRTRHIDDVRDFEGRPYEQTRVRLQLFREDIELDDIDVDFDNAADASIFETERDRSGFRAEFGKNATGGFVQVFREKLRAPALLTEEFVNHGVGFGAHGVPRVARIRNIDLLVPWRVEGNLVGGSERTGGFDQDLFYAESNFEVGFGARTLGIQATTGLIANSIGGVFDTDLPSPGDADISGTNVGAFFEVLYKHPRVPLMGRIRAIAGDVQGIMLSFGFAF